MRILAVSGSLRRDSYNTRLLRAAEELAPADVVFDRYDELESVPPYNEDRDTDEAPLAVAHLRRRIEEADAVLIATPEYNSSIPGQLKNAVDWASRPTAQAALRNKPVAVIGASTGMFGAVWAQAELRKVLGASGARVVDRELPVVSADEAFEENGALKDRDLSLELEGVLAELLYAAERRRAA
jgi:chromate reductase, NAD(P)H dehydrogenase (quinone)